MFLSENNKKRLQKLSGILSENISQNNESTKTLDEISVGEIKLPNKYVHEDFNQEIWDVDTLKKEILDNLKEISKNFYDYLKIDVPIKDIWFTGSLANYNWTKFSDIDLHILIDYSKINKDSDFVLEYLDAKKDLWNNNHDIKIKGFDVELYAQNYDEQHTSTGIYSILNDKWVIKPSKVNPKINKNLIKQKIKYFVDEIEKVEKLEDFQKIKELGKEIKDKMKKMRKSGLEKKGEYSEENLVFKFLRNNGYIGRLMDKINNSFDSSVSITEEVLEVSEFNEKSDLISVEKLIEIVEKIQNNKESFYESELYNKMLKFSFYELKDMPISIFKIDESKIDNEILNEYIKIIKFDPDYTPIIYDSEKNDIIDGLHRVKALQILGYETVRAYVGVIIKETNEPIMNESIRKIIRKQLEEMFNAKGFHASMEDWVDKWAQKGVDIPDSYGDGIIMDVKKKSIISEEEITEIKEEGLNPEDFDYREIEIGQEVEMEHTDDRDEALKIAMQHLKERGDYYSKSVECGIVDEDKALNIYDKYFSKDSEKINENNEDVFKNALKKDNLEKVKNISKIVFGMTGDEDMATDIYLSMGSESSEAFVLIPMHNRKEEDEDIQNLYRALLERGYNTVFEEEEGNKYITVDLTSPTFALNEDDDSENNDNFHYLAPLKHNVFLEKNISDEHGHNSDLFKEFIIFCCKEGGIEEPTKIFFRGTRDEKLATTASYNPNNHEIHIYSKGRHKVDIMRSLAHELMHMIQMLENRLYDNSGDDGSPEENEAHSFAGLMIRKFGKKIPKIYEGYKGDLNKNII